MDFIQKSFYVLKTTYIGLAIEFLNNILIVRYLGSENYGAYTVLYILPILITSLGSFGFGPSIVYHVNKLEFNISKYLGTFTILGLALGFIYLAIFLFLLPHINQYFYEDKLNTDLFIISILFVPLMITQKYLRAIVRGMYKIKLFSFLLDLTAPCLRLILIIFVIYLELGLKGIVCIPVITQLFITSCFFIYLFKMSKINLSSLLVSKNDFIRITRFAFKNYLGTALQKSNETFLMLIASTILTLNEVGLISLAKKLLRLIVGFSDSVITVLMPKVSRSEIYQIRSDIPKITSILFFFSIIFITLYLSFLESIIKIIYGNDFIGIVKFSIPLALVTIFLPFGNILLTTITHTGDPIKKFYSRAIGFIFNLLAYYPLFLFYGAFGFVVSIAMGQFIIFLTSLFFFKRKFDGINLYKLFIIEINDIKYLFKILKKQISK